MKVHHLRDLAKGNYLEHWEILGPFVVKTGDHFEREYMNERELILDIDYLAADGGEVNLVPEMNRSYTNIGLGPKQLSWRAFTMPWLDGGWLAGDIIYETVQRNCIHYAAAWVEAEQAGPALLDAKHSGMKVWVNHELVCNEPYGFPKGVRLSMNPVPIKLKAGLNLFMFKVRPGFICDGVDFNVREIAISPLTTNSSSPLAIGRFKALPHFRGTPEAPRQVIEAYVQNSASEEKNVCIQLSGNGGHDVLDMTLPASSISPIRMSLPVTREQAGETINGQFVLNINDVVLEAPFALTVQPVPKYDGTNYILTAFHFDTTYHEEQRVYAMGAFDIVRQYCRLHRADPLFRSVISEIDYLKPYFDVYPEDREMLLQVFREKKSEPDVMYNQPNEQNCGDEALVRNFLYGQLIHGKVFGNICHVYGPGDVFGHPNQLSQIARKSGCIGISWAKHIFNLPPFFDHLSLDGVAIPHQRGRASEDDVHKMGSTINIGEADQTPATDWHQTLMPIYKQGTWENVIADILHETEEKGAHLPVTSRDISLYHTATAMSRTDLKIANRLCENLLLDAEKFATIATLLGAIYPEKALDKAWRQLLCGQHHDSITGTHNEISFVDLMNSYREALELTVDVHTNAQKFIADAIAVPAKTRPLVIFNSLAWERTDVVRTRIQPPVGGFILQDTKGKNVPFDVMAIYPNGEYEIAFVARKMPSLGYRTYTVVPQKQKMPVRKETTGTVIENEFYRIEIDPERGGGMVALFDKEAKRNVIDTTCGHVGNELAVLEEVEDRNETQHEFYTTGLKMFSGEKPARVALEKGAVSTTLRVQYTMGELCETIQEITLFKGIKRIEFKTILRDMQEENYLYCVTFPTNLKGLTPVFDERFGAVARNESKHYLDFRTHQMCMFSDCAVYAANKWMEYGNSAVLRMGKNAYGIRMVGVITPDHSADIEIAEDLERTLVRKGITCTPWRDSDGPHWGSYLDHMDDDLLYTRFRISMGTRGVNVYTRKLLAAQPVPVRKAFQERLKKDGYAFLFVKDPDLKYPSWPALPVLIIEAKTTEKLAAAVAKLMKDFPATAEITIPATCNASGEQHTIDAYGIAMLNRGTYANSVEKDGVLCMMLTHTCLWYGGTNNFPEGYLIPENKTHAYVYALYPHAGDWREAETQRRGHEYNHPLTAVLAEGNKKGSLPAETTFVSVEPANVILTAMKPFGNPIASFERLQKPEPTEAIMVRVYDAEGEDSLAHITFNAGIQDAWKANLLEEKGEALPVSPNGIALPVPAFSIETVGFKPGILGKPLPSKPLGIEVEPVQPVWVRSWEHDAESMPMGYEPVVCSISREVKEEEDGRLLRIKVNTVNDYTDTAIQGSATLIAPEGWRVEPAKIDFDLQPLGYQFFEVVVTRPDNTTPGQLKLRHEYDGQIFQDVLEVGGAFNLEMTAENKGDVIVVTLKNPTAETIEAEVAMVTPVETWPQSLIGEHALWDISPRTRGVSIAPGAVEELQYTVTRLADEALVPETSYWAVAKLMSNGRIQLKRCDCHPQQRRMWASRWFKNYNETRRYEC